MANTTTRYGIWPSMKLDPGSKLFLKRHLSFILLSEYKSDRLMGSLFAMLNTHDV